MTDKLTRQRARNDRHPLCLTWLRVSAASGRGKEAASSFHTALVKEEKEEDGGGWAVLLVGQGNREVKRKSE